MKKIIRGCLLFCAMFLLPLFFTSCENNQNESSIIASLEFEKSVYEIEVGEQAILKVQFNHLDGNMEWSCEDPSVISLHDGEIVGLKVGKTTVTVKMGDYHASCEITVKSPSVVGTLSVDYDSLRLNENTTMSITASLIYKENEVEDVEYIWSESSNNEVITLSPNGNVCQINTLVYGESTITVRCIHLGVTLEKQIEVKVIRDISVEIINLNLTETGYELSLVNYVPEGKETEYRSEFVPEIKVTSSGKEIIDATYSLSLTEDNLVVDIIDNKIKALNEGNTNVKLTYTDDSSAIVSVDIFVSVSLATIEMDQNVDFDQTANSVVFDTSVFEGEIQNIQLENDALSFTKQENQVIVTGYDALMTGEHLLKIQTNKAVYQMKATVVTMILDSKEDLDNLHMVSKVNDVAVWDGYFVLGNDIEYNGVFSTFCGQEQGGTWGGETGFVGIFDGRGYSIKGFATAGAFGGLFGTIGTNGIVKNVGFIDAEIKDSADRSGIVASFVYGKISNVFVQVKQNGAWWCGGIAEYVYPSAEISNSIVYVTQTNMRDTNLALTAFSFDNAILKNNYSVGALELYRRGGDSPVAGEERSDLRKFNSYLEMKNANLDVSTFDANIWELSSGVPVFKSYLKYVENHVSSLALTNDVETKISGSLSLTGALDFVYSIKEVMEGVYLEDNVLTINGHYGETITIVASYLFDSNIWMEKTFTIAEKPNITLSKNYDVDLSQTSTTLTIGEVNVDVVRKVQIGENEVSFSQNAEQIVLSNYATIPYGEYEALFVGDQANYAATIVVATKIINSIDDWTSILNNKVDNKIVGYYVLNANLDYTGVSYGVVCSLSWGSTAGFAGVFDGRRHSISNLALEGDGLGFFGTICLEAVIKNVCFVSASIAWGGQGGILGNLVYGTIENVSISFSSNGGWWTGGIGCFIRSEAQIKNCVVEVLAGSNTDSKTAFGACVQDVSSITNCYSFGALPFAYIGADSPVTAWENTTTEANYASIEEMQSLTLDLSHWNLDVWDVSQNYPSFKKVVD